MYKVILQIISYVHVRMYICTHVLTTRYIHIEVQEFEEMAKHICMYSRKDNVLIVLVVATVL